MKSFVSSWRLRCLAQYFHQVGQLRSALSACPLVTQLDACPITTDNDEGECFDISENTPIPYLQHVALQHFRPLRITLCILTFLHYDSTTSSTHLVATGIIKSQNLLLDALDYQWEWSKLGCNSLKRRGPLLSLNPTEFKPHLFQLHHLQCSGPIINWIQPRKTQTKCRHLSQQSSYQSMPIHEAEHIWQCNDLFWLHISQAERLTDEGILWKSVFGAVSELKSQLFRGASFETPFTTKQTVTPPYVFLRFRMTIQTL